MLLSSSISSPGWTLPLFILSLLFANPITMVIIERDPPPTIKGYLTETLTPAIIDEAVKAFKRGAYDAYDPLVKLELDETRFIGQDVEKVRDTLDGENMKDPFIVFDSRTRTDMSAWWVDLWADQVLSGDELQEWLTHDVTGVTPGTRVLIKSRRKIVDIGTFYDAIENGETDIMENLPKPYNPLDGNVAAQSVFNWDTDPPRPPEPFVVAAPDEFETSTDEALRRKFFIPPDKYPDKVVRLIADVATRERLVSEWTVITKNYDGGYGPAPAGSIVMQQNWVIVALPGTAGTVETS